MISARRPLTTLASIIVGLFFHYAALGQINESESIESNQTDDLSQSTVTKSEETLAERIYVLPPDVQSRPWIEENDESSMSIPEGFMLIEGDMIVPDDYYEVSGQRGAFESNLWPNGVVPYVWGAGTTTARRQAMRRAMDNWEQAAKVHFLPRTGQTNYISIKDDPGNWSYVGMQGGMQEIGIYNWNVEYIMSHELGHCLGLVHEQSRTDRDAYVEIVADNISQTACSGNPCNHNFAIAGTSTPFGAYDFESVMHYGPCAFSVCAGCPNTTDPTCPDDTDGGVTIAMLPGHEQYASVIGQRSHFSTIDVQTMAHMYPNGNCMAPDHLAGHSVDFPMQLGVLGFFEDDQLNIHDPDERDWFTFTTCLDGPVTVTLSFTHDDGDIDLCVYDSAGFPNITMACSKSISDDEEVTFEASAGQTYYVKAYIYPSVSPCNSYTLTISGPTDPYEPNNDWTTATDLGELGDTELTGLSISSTSNGVSESDRDIDWFTFDACNTGKMRVLAEFVHANGDLNIRVIERAPWTVVADGTSTTNNEDVEFDTTAGKTYLVRVQGANDQTCNEYDLAIYDFPIITCPADVTIECDQSIDPSNPAVGEATAEDDCDQENPVPTSSDSVAPGDCPSEKVITRTWSATDAFNNESSCEQVITVVDTVNPDITSTGITEGDVDENCEFLVEFQATVTDNCCIQASDVDVQVELTSGNAQLTDLTVITANEHESEVSVSGSVLVSSLLSCPAVVQVTINAVDCCDRAAEEVVLTAEIWDRIAPEITCPADIVLPRGDMLCNDDVFDWLNSTIATDNCDVDVDIVNDAASNGFACGFPYDSSTQVTWTATDDCGNTSACSATITIEKADRTDGSTKGSLLVFPKVELRWDSNGTLIQDTFIQLTNDYTEQVFIQTYLTNGDPPVDEDSIPGERAHPGWNRVGTNLALTGNQSVYFSILSGEPAGLAPLTSLDPAFPLGRPATDGTNDRVLRGYLVVWAIDSTGGEIEWDHLAGKATLVNYDNGTAWQYNAWTYASSCVGLGNALLDCTAFDSNGTCCDAEIIPGLLETDAFQYDFSLAELKLEFFAAGAHLDINGPNEIATDTDVTLLPLNIDYRQEAPDPVITKAKFSIWNMNEVKFSGTERCITMWDQQLVSHYNPIGNHFLVGNIHTDFGHARVNGIASSYVCGPESVDSALVGVAMTLLEFSNGNLGNAGNNMAGMGMEYGVIRADPQPYPGGPPQK